MDCIQILIYLVVYGLNYLYYIYNNYYNDLSNDSPKIYYSDSKTYINFYYENAKAYFGIIYNNGTNVVDVCKPILFTLRVSYDGTKIAINQLNEATGITFGHAKSNNNTYITFYINYNSKDLAYLQLWTTIIN